MSQAVPTADGGEVVDVNRRGILDIGQDVSRTLHAVDVLAAVQQRLERTGAHESLHHFHRMSPCELTILVSLEAGVPPIARVTPCSEVAA